MNCKENAIKIYRGDDTNWNGENLLNFVVTSASPEIDLSTMTAKFIVGSIVFDNIPLTTGEFTINFTHQQTATMPWGLNKGVLQILDSQKRIKTVTNAINLFVTSEPFAEQSQTINVTVPETSPVEITLTIGGGSGGGSWGSITGDIQNQEDLQAEFDTKMDKSGGTFTGDVTLAQGVSLKTQVGELHDVNDNIVLGGKGTNYGLYVAPDGSAAALVGNNSLKDIITTADVKSTYSASGTDPVNGVAVASALSPINAVIPSQATAENQLADKNFVNSSVSTNTAYFIGTFNSVADLEAYSGTLTNNDYAFVIGTDSAGNTVYNRYKYTTATDPASWQFEYALNNSSFTADQWAAINSGATTTNIGQIATNTSNITSLQTNKLDVTTAASTYATQSALTTGLAGKQDTISDLDTIRAGAAKGATSLQPADLEGVFTDETLLGGENIEIVPQPIGFDANTLACWHFDGDLIDAKNSLELTPSSSNASSSTEAYKFGTGSMKIKTAGTYARCVSATYKDLFSGDFTIDFWIRKYGVASGNAGYVIFGLSNNTTAYVVESFPFYFSLGKPTSSYPYDNKVLRVNNTQLGTAEITVDNQFHHVALVFTHSNSTVTGYLDGVKAGTYTFSTLPSNTQNLCFAESNNGGYYVDEFRISNVARWTEDFTPPTTPYPNGDPTGNYVVNMVNTNNKYIENDGTYLRNTATGADALTIEGDASSYSRAVNIGKGSQARNYATRLGYGGAANGTYSTALGYSATCTTTATNSVMLGSGSVSEANNFSVGFQGGSVYKMLDGTTGIIPDARLPIIDGGNANA